LLRQARGLSTNQLGNTEKQDYQVYSDTVSPPVPCCKKNSLTFLSFFRPNRRAVGGRVNQKDPQNDAEEGIQTIQLTDDEVPIDLVLHTPGGVVLASLQIARAIKARKGKVTVFVPHKTMSGGSLNALAADQSVS